jgi:dTDP-4-dehydrorhamnose 3,5-epimerase-like enzyme
MAKLIELNTYQDLRGNLTVVDRELPFSIKRSFFIYNVNDSIRGEHRHKKTRQAAICIQGSCKIYNNNSITENVFTLDSPNLCLIIEPEDWHSMYAFSDNAILLVFASEFYDKNDYIYERY